MCELWSFNSAFSLPKQFQNLHPSCRMDINFLDCFKRAKTSVLQPKNSRDSIVLMENAKTLDKVGF